MICLLEWANAYLDFCKRRFVRNTYKEKVYAFRLFFRSVSSSMSIDELNKGHVLAHFTGPNCEGCSGNSLNRYRKDLVAAWNWGLRYLEGLPAENPFQIDRFSETRYPRYVPPLADFWAVLAQTESKQDYAFLLSYLYLAARRSELFRLRIDDVDLERKLLRLGTKKRVDGSLEYNWLPIADPLFPVLSEHLTTVSGPWVFPNPKTGKAYHERAKWMKRLCAAAGVKPFGLHSVRHLTASLLAERGVPLVQIQQILRHTRLTTTERYIRSLGGCRDAVAVLPSPLTV